MAALGHEVHVITHQAATEEPALRVHRLVRNWSFWAIARVRQLAASLSLDIVNIQYQAAAYGLGAPIHFLPKLLAQPSVVTFHDLRIPYLFPKAGPLRRRAVRMLARSAGNVIVTNFDDRTRLEREGGIRCLAEIPIGSNINAQEFYSGGRNGTYAEHFGLTGTAGVVGYFGFLSASKGARTLLEALAKLPNYQLLLIGGKTGSSDPTNVADADALDKLVVDLGLENRVQRTGYLSPAETTQALLACDLMAMPYGDGASLRRGSLMACLAHAMPTITTFPTMAVPELKDRQNVFMIPVEDAEALAQAIQSLSGDEALRKRLSSGARQVAQGFTWDKIAQQTVDFYRQVLATRHDQRAQL